MKNTLASRGIIEDAVCPLCKAMPETILHLLRDCNYACDFWYKLSVPPDVVQSSLALDLETWLQEKCLSEVSHQSSVPWKYLLPYGSCGNIETKWPLKILL